MGKSADTRSKILTAAGPVFAEHGFDGATVREICAAAEVNVASVAYYFGDKLGLYHEVIQGIREARERKYPAPTADTGEPRQMLYLFVRTILSRMLACDASGWESQLLMREMQSPTPAFEEIVNEFFRPLFDRLTRALQQVAEQPIPEHTLHQLALSVIGQCFYYKFGAGLIQILIPQSERESHYDIDTLTRHVTAVMLSATENAKLLESLSALEQMDLKSPSGDFDLTQI